MFQARQISQNICKRVNYFFFFLLYDAISPMLKISTQSRIQYPGCIKGETGICFANEERLGGGVHERDSFQHFYIHTVISKHNTK